MIKRIITILLGVLLICGCGVYKNNISYCQYIGGYWGQWKNYYEYNTYGGYGTRWAYWGEKDNFVVYRQGDHPSDFSYRITILSFDESKLPKDEWKEYRKNWGSTNYFDLSDEKQCGVTTGLNFSL